MWSLLTSRPARLGEGSGRGRTEDFGYKRQCVALAERGDGGLWLECCVGFESRMARSRSLKAAASGVELTSASRDWPTEVWAVFRPSHSQ